MKMLAIVGKIAVAVIGMVCGFFLIPKPARAGKWFRPIVWGLFFVLMIYAAHTRHWLHFASLVTMLAGATMNWWAVWRGRGRMPVWRPRRDLRRSATHYSSPHFVFAGDWINVGVGKASPGDLLLAIGFLAGMLT